MVALGVVWVACTAAFSLSISLLAPGRVRTEPVLWRSCLESSATGQGEPGPTTAAWEAWPAHRASLQSPGILAPCRTGRMKSCLGAVHAQSDSPLAASARTLSQACQQAWSQVHSLGGCVSAVGGCPSPKELHKLRDSLPCEPAAGPPVAQSPGRHSAGSSTARTGVAELRQDSEFLCSQVPLWSGC